MQTISSFIPQQGIPWMKPFPFLGDQSLTLVEACEAFGGTPTFLDVQTVLKSLRSLRVGDPRPQKSVSFQLNIDLIHFVWQSPFAHGNAHGINK
jgi:hypothetical protein